MYITTTDKLDPSSSITVASSPATQVEIDKVLRIWPSMSESVENLALLYRRQQAELNAKDTDFKRLWQEHPSSPMVPSIPPALLVAGSISSGGKTFTKKIVLIIN